MISHEEALRLIRENVRPPGTERLAVAECTGRILAEDIVARRANPPFNKAAMDGFAARASDLVQLPAELALTGESFAGGWPEFHVGPGQCARITTGAPVPEGADVVVMVEHTEALPDGRIRIREAPADSNICAEGEDMAEGQTVLRAGRLLTPLRVGVAASAGHGRLTVRRLPSVALVCTGSEVVEPPAQPSRGQIYNSNGPILSALLVPVSSEFQYLTIAADTPDSLEQAFRRGLETDLLVITGGVSVGMFDLVPDLLRKAGVEILFHRCAIKPGKPVLFGVHGGGCVFGLPGNPLSSFIIFQVLVRAALAHMAGADDVPPDWRTGIVTEGFPNKPARKNFKPCLVSAVEGVNRVEMIASRGSADIMSASRANAIAAIPRGVESVQTGQEIEFFRV